MIRILLSLGFLGIGLFSLPGQANLAYRFDITTAYAAADPFPNRIDNAVSGPATGYIQVTNAGPGDYRGIIRLVAFSQIGGDMGFNADAGLIPSGGTVSIGLPNDSAAVGGFNGPSYTFRPGIILYMEGGVTTQAAGGWLKIGVQDLDIRSGVFRVDPNGLVTDDFVLQGGDPFGFYNGTGFSLGQAWGHATLSGVAIGEPGGMLPLGVGLLLLGFRGITLRRSHAAHPEGVWLGIPLGDSA